MLLWGNKTEAIFDVWSIEHILSGISVGSFALRYRFGLVWVLFLAYLWETVEHYLEVGLMGRVVADWFYGVEFWGNRVIADPIMMIVGYYIAKRFSGIENYARIISVIWLIIHIFIFPHSMYLHNLM